MTTKKVIVHSESTKKIRRRIEEVLRNEITEDQIIGLAKLLEVDITTSPDKKDLIK